MSCRPKCRGGLEESQSNIDFGGSIALGSVEIGN